MPSAQPTDATDAPPRRPILRLRAFTHATPPPAPLTPPALAPAQPPSAQRDADVAAIRAALPHLLQPPRPLAVGIAADVAALTGITGERLAAAMWFIVGDTRYLRALSAPGAARHGVDGTPVGPVSEDHAAFATLTLSWIAERNAARKFGQPRGSR